MSELQVVSNAEAAREAARHIARRARERLAERATFSLALSGGSTPRQMLAELAGMDLDWSRLHVFQVDERVAPAGDAARNLNMINETLIARAVLPEVNLHPMPVDADELEGAAEAYARELATVTGTPPVLDLVHLGLGDDGHTASLVPGDAVLAVDDVDVAVCAEYRGHRRLTLTYPALERAREVLWLATGADKAEMLSRLIARDATIPAGRLRASQAILFTDLTPS